MSIEYAESVTRNSGGLGQSNPRTRQIWKLRCFLVVRRDDRKVRCYRSQVCTPCLESAELGIGLSPDEVARSIAPNPFDHLVAGQKIKPEEVADFWENVAITLEGGGHEGLALVRGTRMAVTARMRGMVGTMRWRMNQGVKLCEAMAEFPTVFSPDQIALAEAGGELPPPERASLYLSLANALRERAGRSQRFWSTMLDQIITGIMLVFLAVITLVYFIPNFARMFASMDVELPMPYRIAAAAGRGLTEHWPVSVPFVIALVAGFWIGVQRLVRAPSSQRLLARVPVAGPLIRSMALARALPVFAILHKAAVTPRTNFRLAAAASGNAFIADFFGSVYRRCEAGMPMEQAFMAERLRLGLQDGRRLAGKIEAGSELGDVEGVLKGLAQEFGSRASVRIEALPKVIKPFNLAVMGLVIGVIAALVGMPSMLVLEKTLARQNEVGKARIQEELRDAQAAAHETHTR